MSIFSKNIRSIFVILLCGVYISGFAKEDSMFELRNKPYYEYEIEARNLSLRVLINDVIVFEMHSSDQSKLVVPINHWMHPEKNKVGIHFWKPEDGENFSEDAFAEVALLLSNDDAFERKEIFSLTLDSRILSNQVSPGVLMPKTKLDSHKGFSENDRGDVVIDEARLLVANDPEEYNELSRNITFLTKLPMWSFFNADILDLEHFSDTEIDEIHAGLLKEYLKVYDALKANKIENIMPMFAERNREYDAALHYKPGTVESKIRDDLTKAARNDDLELLELTPDNVALFVYPNRRLIKMVRGGMSPAIAFRFKSLDALESYNLIFRRQNGKWILTR